MPQTTATIFLGASQFVRGSFTSHNSFAKSKTDFEDYLRSQPPNGLGLRSGAFLDLFDSTASAGDQLKRITEFLEKFKAESPEAVRDLIVYYVGHGCLDGGGRGSDYCLVLASTERDFLDTTGLRFKSLAEVLKRSAKAYRTFYILDCCFAGKALRSLQSGSDEVAHLASTALEVEAPPVRTELPKRGSALLCAANADEFAHTPDHLSRTAFSDSLIHALEKGDPDLHEKLTLVEACDLVWERLSRENKNRSDPFSRPVVHAPDQTDGNVAAKVPLFPNPAYEGHARSPAAPRQAKQGRPRAAPKQNPKGQPAVSARNEGRDLDAMPAARAEPRPSAEPDGQIKMGQRTGIPNQTQPAPMATAARLAALQQRPTTSRETPVKRKTTRNVGLLQTLTVIGTIGIYVGSPWIFGFVGASIFSIAVELVVRTALSISLGIIFAALLEDNQEGSFGVYVALSLGIGAGIGCYWLNIFASLVTSILAGLGVAAAVLLIIGSFFVRSD
jgi:hypothetical protein